MMLGILLANPNEVSRALRYARAAHELGHEVQIFVTFEAIKTLDLPIWDELVFVAKVFACAQTTHQYQVKAHPQVTLGSQFDHAEIAQHADRFLALT